MMEAIVAGDAPPHRLVPFDDAEAQGLHRTVNPVWAIAPVAGARTTGSTRPVWTGRRTN